MAGKSGKSTGAMQDVEGYIHNVSPIKTPASGNRYFDFKIQERIDTTRVVCFHPDKQETLKQKEAAKSPVRIVSVSPQKRKYEPDTVEYKMGNKSKVINTTNMPFPWAEVGDNKPKEVSISNIFTSNPGDVVSLKATVVSKSDRETVYSHTMRKSLHMCNIVLADATGAIRATVWESMIDQVSEGVSYEFNKFKINFFNHKYLNGTPESEVNETKVVEVSPEILPAAEELIKPKAKQTNDENGRIIGVDVQYIAIQLLCNTSMLKEFLKPTVNANLVIINENGENLGKFHCSGTVLNAMFESVKGTEHYSIDESDVTKLSWKLISQTLLLAKKVSFKLSFTAMEVAK